MRLWVRRSSDADLRVGIVAGKRVGKAHVRSRAKRLLREAWRLNRYRFHTDCDVVLSAQSGAGAALMQEVEAELLKLAEGAGILRTEPEK